MVDPGLGRSTMVAQQADGLATTSLWRRERPAPGHPGRAVFVR